MTLSDFKKAGNTKTLVFGGHLMKGTKVFACEVTIEECDGEPLANHAPQLHFALVVVMPKGFQQFRAECLH